MQIRLFLILILIFGLVYIVWRSWPLMRRHPLWGPLLTRMAPQVLVVVLLRRALPALLRLLQTVRWFR